MLLALAPVLPSQCQPSWNRISQLGFGVNGQVRALQRWDPDGAGPLSEVMVVAGGFTEAGGIPASNIAIYDPISGTWSSIGGGANGTVSALAVAANGDLLMGGVFTAAGGVSANGVARWNGSSWQPLGVGLDVMPGVSVRALAVSTSGEIFAGGDFSSSGGNPLLYFARWNGTSWQQAGAGLASMFGCPQMYLGVTGLLALPNGEILASGQFSLVSNSLVQQFASWDGTTWQGVPGAPAFTCVTCMTQRANGDIVVGGSLNSTYQVQSWDGSSWQQLGAVPDKPLVLAGLANGDVLVSTTGTTAPGIFQWTGVSWLQRTRLPAILQFGLAIAAVPGLAPDAFMVGGNFTTYGSTAATARGLLLWDGVAWTASPGGLSGGVDGFCAMANGDVIAGGTFTQIGGVPATNVARWNGTTWSAVGNAPSGVYEVAALDSGEIFAGTFYGTYRWAGSTWQQISTTTTWGLLARRNGRIVAWDADITEWDGTGWTTIPGARNIIDVVEAPNGDLIAIGRSWPFLPLTTYIARWDGSSWTDLDPTQQLTYPPDLVGIGPGGSVVVSWTVHTTPPTIGIMEFDGTSWHSINGGFDNQIMDLLTLPDGDLVAMGLFQTTGGPATSAFIARWDGTAWNDVAGGPGQPVWDAAMRPSGEIFVSFGGFFGRTFALATSPCLPRSTALGNGCPGSGGANRLTALTWPQVGAPYLARGTELPATGFVVDVIGLQASTVALSTLTPLAPVGCTGFVSPLANSILSPVDGLAIREFDVPNTMALVGVTFRHQMFPVETDPLGAVVALTATNALNLIIGSVL
ncbi:MAG: hypothetical protein KDC98_17370 [Planctomycetes bacterium]|nr:hypothetical protein [Planctomycetota bacterium]